ncbi:universal stress protein [Anaerospora sp.]|jgi:nucleotide-binding universal stress UspA family protein|uniref:universal stress protein n=1 Tax=Anaerospora sp. TaxID=1960278 RepID=UPI0028964FBC|nr:universal stress protein [Anaerospora sp.]MDF2929804.1 putative universal stress protein [Anaerospora sp.]
MKKDLLVPFDGSKNATEALQLAITWAKMLQEKIVLLNVQHSFRTVHTKMFFNDHAIHEYQEQLFHEAVAPAKKLLEESGVEFEIKLRIGDAKEQICLEATLDQPYQPGQCLTTGVRMIIMGSRGMNPVLGGLLGSVSYSVVNAAPCMVTIVPYSCD